MNSNTYPTAGNLHVGQRVFRTTDGEPGTVERIDMTGGLGKYNEPIPAAYVRTDCDGQVWAGTGTAWTPEAITTKKPVNMAARERKARISPTTKGRAATYVATDVMVFRTSDEAFMVTHYRSLKTSVVYSMLSLIPMGTEDDYREKVKTFLLVSAFGTVKTTPDFSDYKQAADDYVALYLD